MTAAHRGICHLLHSTVRTGVATWWQTVNVPNITYHTHNLQDSSLSCKCYLRHPVVFTARTAYFSNRNATCVFVHRECFQHLLWSGWTVLSLNLFSFNAPQCVCVCSLSLPPSVSVHSTRFAETLSCKVSVSALCSLSPTRVGRLNAWFLMHNLHRSPYM